MENLNFKPQKFEKNKEGSLTEVEVQDIVKRVSILISDLSLPNTDINEGLSKIKKAIAENSADRTKNDLYSYAFLGMISKAIEKIGPTDKVPEDFKNYIKEEKEKHYIPGMEEEKIPLPFKKAA